MYKTDLAFGIGLFAFGALMAFVLIPFTTYQGVTFGLPPTFFPTLLSVCLMIFSLCLIAQSIYRIRLRRPRPSPISRLNLMVFIIAVAIIVAGVVLIHYAGLFVGAPLLIAAMMMLLAERSALVILLTSTIPVVSIYLLARHVLIMPLP
jgi:hypothetical protein